MLKKKQCPPGACPPDKITPTFIGSPLSLKLEGSKYDKNLLRKYLYKWYSKAMKMKSKDKKDDRLKEIRRKVFSKLVKTIKNRQNKNLLRKYFFKWLKKAIKMALKDERDKLRNLDKTYRTK